MGARAVLRGAVDLGRVLIGDLARWGGNKIVGFLFSAPSIEERFPANPGLPEEDDEVLTPTTEEVASFQRERGSMVAVRRPPEDNPPNEPLVGSLEWRRQQQRAAR